MAMLVLVVRLVVCLLVLSCVMSLTPSLKGKHMVPPWGGGVMFVVPV